LGGISVDSAVVEERGLRYDRRWMLIDENGTFITQRKYAELSLLAVKLEADYIEVSHKMEVDKAVKYRINEHSDVLIAVTIWDDATFGYEVNPAVSAWFTNFMQMNVRLVKMAEDARRLVDTEYAYHDEVVSFADGYPCLLIGQSALDGLNAKLDSAIRMDRFRPNFVFTGGEPHVEDDFATFSIGEVTFNAVKPCARCVLTTIDQQTGAKGAEPLKTLATYRKKGNKIMFGQNLLHQKTGVVRVGDELVVETWK